MSYDDQGSNLEEPAHEAPPIKTVICPRCDSEVPSTLYCLKCGSPLKILDTKTRSNDDMPEDYRFNVLSLNRIQGGGSEIEEDERVNSPDEEEEIEITLNDTTNTKEEHIRTEKAIEPSRDELEIHVETGKKTMPDSIETCSSQPDFIPAQTFKAKDIKALYEQHPEIKELSRELMNSISLQLWAVSLLQEEGISEDHFLKLFDTHKERYEQCMERRSYLLSEAEDIAPLEAIVTEAKVELSELEFRKSIGDLHEGEYEALAPALNWTIQHYEKEISKRREKITLIEDITKLIPKENIDEIRNKTKAATKTMEDVPETNLNINTASKIKSSLEQVLIFLGELD